MNKIKFIFLFLIVCASYANASDIKSNDIKVISKFVTAFIQASEKNDLSKIAGLLGVTNNNDLKYALNNSKLLPYQRDSMLSLISRTNSIVITPVFYKDSSYRQYGNGYTVFFVISDSVSDVLLGKKTWLKDYVACDFFVKKSKINYGLNLCYSESEGPFYFNYGDL